MRRAIRILNLRRLARVRLRMIIAMVAVAAGSSLALSVVIVDSSASYSLTRLSQQVAGSAGLRVVGATSTGGIDFRALGAVASTRGVKEVVPIVQAITVVRTASKFGMKCSPRNGTSTTAAPWTLAQTAYMPKVGGVMIIASCPARR